MNYSAQVLEAPIRSVDQIPHLSSWNVSTGKRIFDLFLTVPLLLLLLLPMLLIAVAVKLSSHGPLLYRQWRLGQRGREFQLFKFRTMRYAPQERGVRLTRAGDSRITPIGRVLRKWKLDELPQLINVIRGEMSLVGPRPDVSEFMGQLDEKQRHVLHLRPGITGWATLRYRHEEQFLSQVPETELTRFYCTKVLPEKVRLDLDYAAKANLSTDLRIVLQTVLAVLI